MRQGDSIGPFFFCLALQPVLLAIKDKVDSLTYMDDIYLVGSERNMVDAFNILKDGLKVLNLEINYKKCWMSRKVEGLPEEIEVNQKPMVMKTPLDYTMEIEDLPAKVKTQIDAITRINNIQVAFILLRQVNNSVLTYALRTASPVMTKKVVEVIGKEIRNALAIILECSKNSIHKAWNRIHMPIGPGLGFVDLRRIAEPAYLASLLQATVNLNGLEEKRISIPQISDNPKPGDYEELLANALKKEEMLRKDPLIKL